MGLSTVALAATVGSGLFTAYTGYQQAKYEQDVAAYNANQAEINRQREMTKIDRDTRRRMGAARASMAATGVRIEGTALDVLGDTAREEQYSADTADRNWQARIMQQQMSGQAASSRARNTLLGGALSTAASGFRTYNSFE